MNFKDITTQLQHLLELYPENAGEEITDFENYEDALNKIKQRYDNNEALAYCPNAIELDYKGNKFSLAVVLGVAENQEDGMGPHGMAHYMTKHVAGFDGKIPTEEDLIKASKNVKNALKQAEHDKKVLYDPFEHKLIFECGKFIYIVCLAKDEKELAYLHTLFIPKSKNYLSKQKKKINQKLDNEIPPYSL